MFDKSIEIYFCVKQITEIYVLTCENGFWTKVWSPLQPPGRHLTGPRQAPGRPLAGLRHIPGRFWADIFVLKKTGSKRWLWLKKVMHVFKWQLNNNVCTVFRCNTYYFLFLLWNLSILIRTNIYQCFFRIYCFMWNSCFFVWIYIFPNVLSNLFRKNVNLYVFVWTKTFFP